MLRKHTANIPHQKSPRWWVVIKLLLWMEKLRQGLLEPRNNPKPRDLNQAVAWELLACCQDGTGPHSNSSITAHSILGLFGNAQLKVLCAGVDVSRFQRAGALRVGKSKQDLLTNPPRHRRIHTQITWHIINEPGQLWD